MNLNIYYIAIKSMENDASYFFHYPFFYSSFVPKMFIARPASLISSSIQLTINIIVTIEYKISYIYALFLLNLLNDLI